MAELLIRAGELALPELRRVASGAELKLALDPTCFPAIDAAAATVARVLGKGESSTA